MPPFELSRGAERDLHGIAQFATRQWGAGQARRHCEAMLRHLEALARGEILVCQPLLHRGEVRLSRSDHHYVLSVTREGAPLLILGILRPTMDVAALRGAGTFLDFHRGGSRRLGAERVTG